MDRNSTPWSSGLHPHPSVHAELGTAAPTVFPRVGYSVLSFLMFINTLLSVFNNGLVITVMLRNPSLLHPMNTFILSLAVSDLMIGLCGSLVVTITNYHGSFFIGHTACVFQGFAVNYFGRCEVLSAHVTDVLLHCIILDKKCKAEKQSFHFFPPLLWPFVCCRVGTKGRGKKH